ncbi:hypothetical protein CDL12_30294 [Handroanthus impetiginosus]|uniref:F-ATPase protein 6 n=1 Tax=Handroanthus impetiginosus TaxID=429701 RepID=A0A2G9FVZ0_9LAMI|nr:hypothetical protein CDL12_30294 [Handroanthus impetiginosus]
MNCNFNIISPLDQFEIRDLISLNAPVLGNLSFSLTNIGLYLTLSGFTVVLGATILGLSKHGLEFFSLFVPAGCPLGLLPLLVLIEFISYLARNVSLGLRLAANILSGLFPLAFIIAFSGLELGIAFIQAQVFVVLSCSYIKDALELH